MTETVIPIPVCSYCKKDAPKCECGRPTPPKETA